jgi:TerB-like protein
MPTATVDAINQWALDEFDDPLLEHEGDDLIIHTSPCLG